MTLIERRGVSHAADRLNVISRAGSAQQRAFLQLPLTYLQAAQAVPIKRTSDQKRIAREITGSNRARVDHLTVEDARLIQAALDRLDQAHSTPSLLPVECIALVEKLTIEVIPRLRIVLKPREQRTYQEELILAPKPGSK